LIRETLKQDQLRDCVNGARFGKFQAAEKLRRSAFRL
jgi:hypothetical protein